MDEKKNTSSKLSGFLDGYKASNIANAESTLRYHIGEIKENIEEMLSAPNQDDEIILLLKKSLKILNSGKLDLLSKFVEFGESFKTTIYMMKSVSDFNKKKIKMVVFHYLELAEKIEDKKLNSLAIEIAELFSMIK